MAIFVKELVQAGFSCCIVSPSRDEDLEMPVACNAVCALQEGKLG